MEAISTSSALHPAATAGVPLLEVRNLAVSYACASRHGDGDTSTAVRDVSFNLEEGEILGIVGESGAGKSTVLHALVGLLGADARVSGSALFDGIDLLHTDERTLDDVRGNRIATIFQNPGRMFNPSMRMGAQAAELICMHCSFGSDEGWAAAMDLFGRMGLDDTEKVGRSYPFQLSGGMQQRVAIAMAMAFEPAIILADEPTSALDTTTQMKVVCELEALNREHGTAIILVTHNIALAYRICSHIIVMDGGGIVEEGPAGSVIDHPREDKTRELVRAIPRVVV